MHLLTCILQTISSLSLLLVLFISSSLPVMWTRKLLSLINLTTPTNQVTNLEQSNQSETHCRLQKPRLPSHRVSGLSNVSKCSTTVLWNPASKHWIFSFFQHYKRHEKVGRRLAGGSLVFRNVRRSPCASGLLAWGHDNGGANDGPSGFGSANTIGIQWIEHHICLSSLWHSKFLLRESVVIFVTLLCSVSWHEHNQNT